MIEKLTKLFPVWAILLSIVAYLYPDYFKGLSFAIIPLLTVVMLGMGMTLTWENFKEIFRTPRILAFGMILQYIVMPFVAFIIAKSFSLSPEFLAGAVLVACAPDGTASSVVTYLAKGSVALSVALTLTSTILGVIVTPSLTYLYLHRVIEVDFWGIMLDVLQIVLIPVIVGTVINSFAKEKIDKIKSLFPFISTIAVILIIAIIVALNKDKISEVNIQVVSTVLLINIVGLILGYYASKLFKFDESICRTFSIEIGMQNSGLAVALAVKYFSAVAALPGAIFSIWHNISGSLVAAYWRMKLTREEGNADITD